jgi:hypothetical protein
MRSIMRHENQVLDTPGHEELRKSKPHQSQAKVTQQKVDGAGSNSAQEHHTPVVKGPSYTVYLRKKENYPVTPLTAYKVRTASHIRTQSYIGSGDGEIVE